MPEKLSNAVVIAVCLLLLVPIVVAQEGRFEEVTQVLVVEVPVQVLRDGEPVRGLTAEDFEIIDGRKKRDIVGYEVIELAVTESRGEPEAGPAVAQLSAAGRRHFLLLFDLSFSDPGAIVRARQAAAELAAQRLHPTDLVAVATYTTSRGAQLVLGFTSDRDQVRLAIDTLGLPQLVESRRDPLGLVLSEEVNFGILAPGGEQGSGREAIAEAEIRELVRAGEEEIRRVTNRNDLLALTASLTELANLMRSVEGRKYVVFLSEGFDSSILMGVSGSTTQEQEQIQRANDAAMTGRIWELEDDVRYGSTSTQNQLSGMLQEFVRADCNIQAVDIGGLRAGADVRPRASSDDGLFMMADGTGGDFYHNFNDLGEAMEEMLERTSVTYLLAFQPDDLEWNGEYRRLKVRLKGGGRGVRLVHRPGYFAPKPLEAQSPQERQLSTASLLLGSVGGQVATSVLATPFEVGEETAYVPLLIEVDGASLMAGQQGGTLPTEIYAYAIDEQGSVRDFFTQAMGLDLTKVGATLESTGFKFWGQFDLPPGRYVARVLVRNSATGAAGLEVYPFEVADVGAGQGILLPPLFPEPSGKWLLARDRKAAQSGRPYPFVMGEAPFIPAARPEVGPGEQVRISLVAYNLPAGSLDVTARLLDADGEAVGKVDVVLMERPATGQPGLDRLVAGFRAAGAAPGDYDLLVTVSEETSGHSQSATIPLRIKAQGSG